MEFRQFIKANTKLILFGFLIIAFGLRFYKIGEHGLAGDEKYSLFVSQFVTYEGNNQHDSVRKPSDQYFTPKEFWSKKSLPDFFDSIARLDTGNGALYTYFLHYWTQLFGVSDGNLRMLSLLFNLLTISLLYVFVKEHFRSENLALLVVFLATISPFYITYSQVARNYSINMFFALMSTHLLLKILMSEEIKEKPFWNYFYYGCCVLACEMCHFATFPLFLTHALFVTIFFRKKRVYVGFGLAMLIPAIGVGLWLNCEGGKWVVDYVTNSVKVYNEMALLHPDEYLNVATLKNILKQLRHVISAMFIVIDGYPALYIVHKKAYVLILTTSIATLLLLIQSSWRIQNKSQRRLRFFIILLSFLPLLSLVLFAFQDGNTFRIMPRYVAYSYGFNLIVISLIIKDLWLRKNCIKYPIYFIFGIQFLAINKLIVSIWDDNPPRYFMGFSQPRKPNPYHFSAQKIIQE